MLEQILKALASDVSFTDFEMADLILVDSKRQLMAMYRDEKMFVVLTKSGWLDGLPKNAVGMRGTQAVGPLVSMCMEFEAKRKARSKGKTDESDIEYTGEYDLLVVDDKLENRRMAVRVLAPYACAMTVVESYGEAMRRLEQSHSYHAVLTDLYMPPDAYHSALGADIDLAVQVPYGLLLAFEASKRGIPVAVVTDADHHRDAISAAFDTLGPYSFHDKRVLFTNHKDWVVPLRMLLDL